MEQSFWSWVLIAIIIAAIFYANDLPKWLDFAKKKSTHLAKEAENKIKSIKSNKK